MIVGLLGSIAIPTLQGVVRDGRRTALVADARDLHRALVSYSADSGGFPTVMSTKTYAPLSTNGYFSKGESLNSKLTGGQPMFYMVTPDGSQYFSFLRMRTDPNVLVVAAHTNLIPGICTGFCDGVFLLQDGELVPVDQGD